MWARERAGCLQALAICNTTRGGLGSGPQGTAPLPMVIGFAGRAGLKMSDYGYLSALENSLTYRFL